MKVGDYVLCKEAFSGQIKNYQLYKIQKTSGSVAAVDGGAVEEKEIVNFSEERIYDEVRVSFLSFTTSFKPCKVVVKESKMLSFFYSGNEIARVDVRDISYISISPNSPNKWLTVSVGNPTI